VPVKRKKKEPIVEQPTTLAQFTEERGIVMRSIEDFPQINVEDARELLRGVVQPNKQGFLLALAMTGNRSRAAQAVDISLIRVWEWMREDPVFVEAFKRAWEVASDLMEDEMIRRGVEGVLEPVYQQGKLVGSIRRHSDILLMFALKAHKPEKYADKQKVEHGLDSELLARLTAGRERALGKGNGEQS
jgi:hypothetical protein